MFFAHIKDNSITAVLKRRNKIRPRILLAGSVMPYIPESRIYYNLLQKMVRDLKVSEILIRIYLLSTVLNSQHSKLPSHVTLEEERRHLSAARVMALLLTVTTRWQG